MGVNDKHIEARVTCKASYEPFKWAKVVNNDDSDNFGGLYTALCGYDYLLMKAVLRGQETYRLFSPPFLTVALILYVCESIVKEVFPSLC